MDPYQQDPLGYEDQLLASDDDDDDNHPYSGRFVPADYIQDDEDDPEDTSSLPTTSDWVHHEMCNVDLRLDDVDEWLYQISKKEITAINNRIKRKLCSSNNFTECEIVAVWLKDATRSLLELVNAQRDESVESFSLDEVILFIKSTMWMMAYNTTYKVY